MHFRRSVVYEIVADDIEAAEDVWADDGPEVAEAGDVSILDEGAIEQIYRTRSGKILTDTDIEALSDEAERGYDVDR